VCTTSRQALGIEGENVYHVSPLSLPGRTRLSGEESRVVERIAVSEAVRLFVARATESSPGFRMTTGNAFAIAEICTHLDGIPLAIELAAARLRVLSVEQIAGRLHDGFRLLTGGSRAALPRQQTLRATLDWSYNLLDAREQMFLRRLSCFTGGATLDAVESVCSGGIIATEDALDLMAALLDRSLAVLHTHEGGEHRYSLRRCSRWRGQKDARWGSIEPLRSRSPGTQQVGSM
jgi:predicted ATPase